MYTEMTRFVNAAQAAKELQASRLERVVLWQDTKITDVLLIRVRLESKLIPE